MGIALMKVKDQVNQVQVNHLWEGNHPSRFWQLLEEINVQAWQSAIETAVNLYCDEFVAGTVEQILFNTLGEGRFGDCHWNLSLFNRAYWMFKPVLPAGLICATRAVVHRAERKFSKEFWPVDDRLRSFLWEILRQYLQISGKSQVMLRSFWPDYKAFALVLTHDVETPDGLAFLPEVVKLEEKYGFRSSFNIVGDQMPQDLGFLEEIKTRGFEFGIHGWHHDSSAFFSKQNYLDAVSKINKKLKEINAVGHRSPLNLRNPEWMQALNIEYDLSFFDTDPFEPISGGTMTIWPFLMGRILELPATLVQDNTLINYLGENSPDIWLEKVDYLQQYHGMALLNSHPDYLHEKKVWKIYESFLAAMQENEHYWNGLPKDVSRWWQSRVGLPGAAVFPDDAFQTASLVGGEVVI